MKKIMSNLDIWSGLNNFQYVFEKDMELVLPAKVSYVIQYNIQSLKEKYDLIEKSRETIGKKYGTFDEASSSYSIPSEKMELAEVELSQLMKVEQAVDILLLDLNDLDNCQLTMAQMRAILFMVKEPMEEGN